MRSVLGTHETQYADHFISPTVEQVGRADRETLLLFLNWHCGSACAVGEYYCKNAEVVKLVTFNLKLDSRSETEIL